MSGASGAQAESRCRLARRLGSTAAVLAALVFVPSAAASDPGAVYSDYARDRVLSCNHSRADLLAALSDATLSQYGDPYTLIGLKRAIRKQLADGCSRAGSVGQTSPDRSAQSGAAGGKDSGDERLLLLGACLLLLIVGTGGWAARRAVSGEQ